MSDYWTGRESGWPAYIVGGSATASAGATTTGGSSSSGPMTGFFAGGNNRPSVGWFTDLPSGDLADRLNTINEAWNNLSFDPNLDADRAELASYRAMDIPTANPYFRYLLKNKIEQLSYKVARREDDKVRRGEMALQDCTELLRDEWVHASSGSDWLGWDANAPTPTPGGDNTSVGSPIRVNDRDISGGWILPEQWESGEWEGPGAPRINEFIPDEWVKKYMAGDTLRPISAQDELGGMKLATLQEMQGVLQEGGPSKINSPEKYIDVAGNFGTHWQDYLQSTLRAIPRFQGSQNKWYSTVQR